MVDAIIGINQTTQPTKKKISPELKTLSATGIGAGFGYATSHFLYNKEIKESSKFAKNPSLIKDSIVKGMGESIKTLSISDLDEYVAEGVKQNKEHIKQLNKAKLAWTACGAATLSAIYTGGKALLDKKDKA